MIHRTILALALAAFGPVAFGSAPPQRIVSTTPSITEILYALGLGDRVVGVTRFCRYPPEAALKPKIGDYINPNLEAIAALKPDLVLIQMNPVRLSERLGTLHLRSVEVDQDSIEAIYRSIRTIAGVAGVVPRGEELIRSIRAKLEEIQRNSAPLKRPRVMFVVGRAPNRLDGLVVVGKASYLNGVIAAAGGENIFAAAVASYPQVSLEEVLARDPEVIIDLGDMGDSQNVTQQHKREVISLWQRASSIRAVKDGRVNAVGADIFVVPGPRVVNAAAEVFAILHPEAARSGNATVRGPAGAAK